VWGRGSEYNAPKAGLSCAHVLSARPAQGPPWRVGVLHSVGAPLAVERGASTGSSAMSLPEAAASQWPPAAGEMTAQYMRHACCVRRYAALADRNQMSDFLFSGRNCGKFQDGSYYSVPISGIRAVVQQGPGSAPGQCGSACVRMPLASTLTLCHHQHLLTQHPRENCPSIKPSYLAALTRQLPHTPPGQPASTCPPPCGTPCTCS
jgi:hypothetical protein